MIKKLTDYTLKKYHRPNDNWVDVPVQTIVDDGELRTTTIRRSSLRKKRQIFTLACTAFTVGLLMILMSSPYSKEFLVPGGLSSNHGQILAGQGADRCAACHGAADSSLTGWIKSTISIGKAKGLTQSELCMKCHDQTFAADTATNPHNVAHDELAQVTQKYQSVMFDAGMVFQPPVHGGKIACSACHREHHGSDHDLTAMTDKQCQTCHTSTFHNFEIGHPEFANYPLKRRARIAFDHTTHAAKHFPGKQTEFNCNQCHVDDSYKNVKQTVGFEQACASCHNQQIIDSGDQGLAIVALPMIDTEAIENAKLKVGTWPLAATGDFDGELPPIMRIMLLADDKAAKVLNRVGPDFDFSDIDPTEPAQVSDAVELVWAIKRLLYDLALTGPNTVRARIESVLDEKISDSELRKMVNNLDETVFQNAVRTWLPNLTVEVTLNRSAEPATQIAKTDRPNIPALNKLRFEHSKQTWWPNEEVLLSIATNDEDLLAPNPLTKLMGGSATSNPGASESNKAVQQYDSAETNSQDNAADDLVQSNVNPSIELNTADTDVSGDPELLAVNPLAGGGGNSIKSYSPTAGTTRSKPTSNQRGGVKNTKPKTNMLADSNKFPTQSESSLIVPSGWFRNDESFNIKYRPSGHSDDCLESWIELVARTPNSDSRDDSKPLFEKTLSMTAIGLCRTCHTVDQMADRSFTVNWKSEYRDLAVRSFTKFSHGAHLIQPNLQDCSHCHSLNSESSNQESFVGFNAADNVSNFVPLTKSNCASCHQPEKAGSNCTQCHNYHVGNHAVGK